MTMPNLDEDDHAEVAETESPSPFPLPVGERGRGEGQRSPRVVFSNRGEKQFAPRRTKAEEHFAEIFLHLMGEFVDLNDLAKRGGL
jgi:hypothetical protein